MVHVVLKVDTTWIYYNDIGFCLQGEYRRSNPEISSL